MDFLVSSNLRWLLLLLLFGYLLSKKKLLRGVNNYLLLILLPYLVWCILTATWSQVFWLSFMKSGMFFVVVIALVSAGVEWVRRYGWVRCLDCLFWVLVVALLSAFFGIGSSGSIDSMGTVQLYEGLSGNANTLGFLLALAFPFLLWRLYYYWSRLASRCLYGGLLGLDLFFLFKTFARGDTLIVLCILLAFLMSFQLRKQLTWILSGALLLLLLCFLAQPLIVSMVTAHFYKQGARTDDVLSSRQKVWQVSYEQAVKGGWFGGGFGATIGDNTFVLRHLAVGSYGREKGNSQLAIIEETGVVGLLFYAMLLITFFFQAIRYYRSLEGSEKVMLGIVLGSLVGLLVESIPEGWWDAPASSEAMCFWTLFGVVIGLINLKKRKVRCYGCTSVEAPSWTLISDSAASKA